MIRDERPTREAITALVRSEWGAVLATLVRVVRDFAVAEDVLQDALVAALEHWPRTGLPTKPRAWLLRTAHRKAIDRFRREARFAGGRDALETLAHDPEEVNVSSSPIDDRIRLIFTCCHPALAENARIALTLRTLGGLTTTEIARAFLVAETTLAQRLVRAQRKIKAAGIPYEVPEPAMWPERLASVLRVLYLIFNEGYAATRGDLTRTDLCHEAIRLVEILARLLPDEAEVRGLLALMLLHDARRPARTGPGGTLVPLEEQDRGRWRRDVAARGFEQLRRAMSHQLIGPYQLQAAISAEHVGAARFEHTRWPSIVALYDQLLAIDPSPVVAVNRAIALSYAEGVEAGRTALAAARETVGSSLDRYAPMHAADADLLRRAGRFDDAAAAYRRALARTANRAERRFLEARLAAVLEATPTSGN